MLYIVKCNAMTFFLARMVPLFSCLVIFFLLALVQIESHLFFSAYRLIYNQLYHSLSKLCFIAPSKLIWSANLIQTLFALYLWSEIHLIEPRLIFWYFKGPTFIYHPLHLWTLSLFLIHFTMFLSKLIWQFVYIYLHHYINHLIET